MQERRSFITTLTRDMEADDNVCLVESAINFPEAGHLNIEGEEIYYDGKGLHSFDTLTRGLRNSIRRFHKAGVYVSFTEPFNPATDALTGVLQWISEDIYVDANGEIFVDNKGDLRVVDGMDALDMSLRIRVRAALGSGIGSRMGVDIAGKTTSDADIKAVVGSVTDTVAAHPAVASIQDVQYVNRDDAVYITMSVFVHGLSQGFEFLYKVYYKDRF